MNPHTSQRPPQQPPPLPGEPKRAQPTHPPKKRKRLTRLWVLLLLIGGGAGFLYWQYELAKFRLFGFQPLEMAMARYTPKDVIGDLGGLKVRIPRHYAEYVVYDGDPRFGEKRKGPVPERTFDSKLRNFGIRARFPDMLGLENEELQQELRSYSLNPDNPWLNMTINSGENYPSMGANARNGLAKHLWEPSPYWRNNYERLPEDVYGLEAYVLSGVQPETSLPAKNHYRAYDVYIQRDPSGHVNTYIRCGRPSKIKGIANCYLHFGLEPRAEVDVKVNFRPSLLTHWKEIQESTRSLLLGFSTED